MSPEILVPQTFAFESTSFSPAIILQVTALIKSYMIWIGTAESSEDASAIEGVVAAQGNLAKDWACAMPPFGVCI